MIPLGQSRRKTVKENTNHLLDMFHQRDHTGKILDRYYPQRIIGVRYWTHIIINRIIQGVTGRIL